MPKFPKREADIVALAEQMVAGYTAHAGDFPSVTVADLQAELTNYKAVKQAQEDLKGQTQIATAAKDEDLNDLVEQMKNDLKKSEVDSADVPQNLYEIGWGPRSEPQPIEAPGTPINLHPIAEGQGTVWLVWDKPASDSGGAVRNYIIERRDQQENGQFGPWILTETTYNTEINLSGQPEAVRVEYRVKASNTAGESMPSNSISVFLP